MIPPQAHYETQNPLEAIGLFPMQQLMEPLAIKNY